MSTPVAILGISAHYHDAAASLVVDGRIVAAASEERFTRVKGCAELPEHAIRYCLDTAGLTPEQLTAVVFYESPFAKMDRLISPTLTGSLRSFPLFLNVVRSWIPNKLMVDAQIRTLLGTDVEVLFGDHHLSHAASAFYPSGFSDSAVLTVDGVGEWSTTTISHGSGSTLTPLEQIEYPNSLGLLYSAFTLYCGFRINSGEYKLMGLAPFGTPKYAGLIAEHLVALHDDGSFALNPEYFAYHERSRTYRPRFEQLLGAPARTPEAPLTQHYADVAASIQYVTDQAMLGLARRAKQLTGAANLCLAGGVALNVVSVGMLEREGIFENIFVQPAAGDAGGALGAALHCSFGRFGLDVPAPATPGGDLMQGAFLGPDLAYGGVSVDALLAEYGFVHERHDDATLAALLAAEIADGSVVALARGRMEFGPRALGARSVLADPRDPQMQIRLNLKTKLREGFRPFAPMVLASKADEWFEMRGQASPYMLKTFPVLERHRLTPPTSTSEDPFERVKQLRSSIPAVTHLDYSARVQTVDAGRHPFVHALITAFDELTGVPVLVNTSFNVRGEPIVCTAREAIEGFIATDIDVLVLDDVVIRRAEQPAGSLVSRAVRVIGVD
jgi:carbamoyltransferase